jgi:hypothetical protein
VENNADFKLTVVANQPRFLHLFMKKLTRERVVPTISAGAFSLIVGISTSGFSSFPKCASSNIHLRRSFTCQLDDYAAALVGGKG